MEVKLIKNTDSTENAVIAQMQNMGHEQILFCNDSATGLKAIIAVHNTVLGPALGGTRMWSYQNEAEALNDVLRLSKGMTYKNAISGLNLGGGKAVIIGNSRTDKTEALFRRFGKFVNSLGGKYITAEDVGISPIDMNWVNMETNHVVGLPGKSGDPSPLTALGVYVGMKACAKIQFGSDSLKGKKVAVQGVGHVGEYLVKYLSDEGADIFISDINKEKLEEVKNKYGTTIIENDSILDFEMDIYAPCALGGILNTETINKLKCKIICGGANNQLEDEERDSLHLRDRGIILAPDFLVNSGGLINVYSEIKGYSTDKALDKTKEIYNTTLDILKKSSDEGITSYSAAMNIAQQRINNIK